MVSTSIMRTGGFCGLCSLLLSASAPAREVLTPEEQAERELEAKRQAPPVLVVGPAQLRMEISEDETQTVSLTVRNAGGGKLVWSVLERDNDYGANARVEASYLAAGAGVRLRGKVFLDLSLDLRAGSGKTEEYWDVARWREERLEGFYVQSALVLGLGF